MKIEKVFVDRDISSDTETGLILSGLEAEPELTEGPGIVYDYINSFDDPVLQAKKVLYITGNQGAVIKSCPGTSHYTCCGYTILNTGTFCTMDCSYCILQAYFHPPALQYFVGFEKLSKSLDEIFSRKRIFRIGTGEYTDSLIWEKISPQPKLLVEKFAGQNNSLLELKTKTVNIKSLLDLDHNRKTVIAWSLNTPDIIRSEERGTASLKSRLEAARLCESKGYRLAFHFDPLLIYEGCEIQYKKVIGLIFEHVSPENIVWISLGTFRFMPRLKKIIEKRFKSSVICYGEFIPGLDNKMRYFKPLRIKLYKELVSCIKEYGQDILVYFCMEDEEVWEKCTGSFPGSRGQLGQILDKKAADHCNLNTSLL